jgi:hypothetical protein
MSLRSRAALTGCIANRHDVSRPAPTIQWVPLAGLPATIVTPAFVVHDGVSHVPDFAVKFTDRTAAAQSHLGAASEPFHEPSGDRLLPG